jgi:hypothetical protein
VRVHTARREGQLIGKFMTYHDAPHAFSRAEIDLAITIATSSRYRKNAR